MSRQGSNASGWTAKQNKAFENALAVYEEDTPERWVKIARAVGSGKTVEDCIRHYADLLEDVRSIEAGHIPFPNYTTTTAPPDDADKRMRRLKLH